TGRTVRRRGPLGVHARGPLAAHHRSRGHSRQSAGDPVMADGKNSIAHEQGGSVMIRTVERVAVVGAGVAGLASAIRLAEAGVEVALYEARPELNPSGSGITLQGNALRIFDHLGVWEDLRERGFAFDGLKLRAPGPEAAVVADLPDV